MIDAVIEELKTHQTQLDQDGVMVGVSRQALEELLAHIAKPAQLAPIAKLEPVLSFLDELAENAKAGKRQELNPILIGESAKILAASLRAQLEALTTGRTL